MVGLDFGAEVDVTQFYPDTKGRLATGSAVLIGGGSRVNPATGDMNVSSTIAAVNLLVRWPIAESEMFPSGRWHPYIGIGGGAQITHAERRLNGARDTGTAPALQVLGGVKAFLTRNVAFFAEYKFTRAAHSFTFLSTMSFPPISIHEDITLGVNHLVGGVAFHF